MKAGVVPQSVGSAAYGVTVQQTEPVLTMKGRKIGGCDTSFRPEWQPYQWRGLPGPSPMDATALLNQAS